MEVESKNVLIISPFFFPELISTGKFNTDIAISLKNRGHKVVVLCSHPLYPNWIPEESHEKIKGIKIIRGGLNINYTKKPLVRRLILELWFTLFLFKNILKYRNKVDIVIPVYPPSLAFFFNLIFLNKKVKKVGMVHDLQEVYSQGKKGVFNKIISFFINKVEGATFRKCDKLIFLAEEMKDTAKSFYNLDESKLLVQYPFSTMKMENITNDLEETLPREKIHIVYSGALGEKQNPEGILHFFEYASNILKNVNFHFFSQGQIFDMMKNKNRNTFIKFHDLVPRDNIEELYSRSDIQLIPQLSGTSKGSLPSKLPNILASGCKTLFITDPDSEIEKLFHKYKLEKVVSSWDNEVLITALISLLKENDNEISLKHKRVSRELFSLDSMIKKII